MTAYQNIAGRIKRNATLLKQAVAGGDADFAAGTAGAPARPGGEMARRAPAAAVLAPAASGGERRIRALIEGASDPVAVIGRDGAIAYISAAIELISGYEPAEYVGRNLAEFVHPQDAHEFAANLAAIIDEPATIHQHLCRLRHRDGGWLSVETSTRNLLDDPHVNGIVVNLRDVTDRAIAQADLARSLLILTTQQEASIDGILVVDASARVISKNRRFLEMWRIPEHLHAECNDHALVACVVASLADPQAFEARVSYLYAHPQESSREDLELRDGRVFDRHSAPMWSPGGTYIGRIWFFRDITDRKRAEAKLQRANRALKTLSACGTALIHATDVESLYAQMCRIVVDVGGYCMAWVGRAESDERKSVTPLKFAGEEAGYLRNADISWADCERGHGATGTCIRTGATQIVRVTDTSAAPWRTEAMRRGYAASIALPLRNAAGVFGTLSIHAGEADAFDAEEVDLLEELARDLSFGVGVLRAKVDHESNLRRLGQIMEATVYAIAGTVEMRDPYTAGHQRRVATLCVAIARSLGLQEERIRGLDLAASIHDVGKIGIPAEILSKPARLSTVEMQLVMAHSDVGYEIVKNIDFPWPIAETIRQHHERLDGSGYPRGLKGDQILLEARIIAVADVVEAMASHRPYRAGLGLEAALRQIAADRATKLDAQVVDACIALFRDGSFDPTQWVAKNVTAPPTAAEVDPAQREIGSRESQPTNGTGGD